jgi:hypothetical protein
MDYTVIDRVDAPAPAPERSKRRIPELDTLIDSLAPGKVARIVPEEGRNSLRTVDQIYKTATKAGKLVNVWEVGGVIYAEPVNPNDA